MSSELARALAHAERIGVAVHIEERGKRGASKSYVAGHTQKPGDEIWLQPNAKAQDELIAWTLLHELGHVQQMRAGKFEGAGYVFWGRTKTWTAARARSHITYEIDAWARAEHLARALGIEVSEQTRGDAKRGLEAHRKHVFDSPGLDGASDDL